MLANQLVFNGRELNVFAPNYSTTFNSMNIIPFAVVTEEPPSHIIV